VPTAEAGIRGPAVDPRHRHVGWPGYATSTTWKKGRDTDDVKVASPA
jgi:hypothetical protein